MRFLASLGMTAVSAMTAVLAAAAGISQRSGRKGFAIVSWGYVVRRRDRSVGIIGVDLMRAG